MSAKKDFELGGMLLGKQTITANFAMRLGWHEGEMQHRARMVLSSVEAGSEANAQRSLSCPGRRYFIQNVEEWPFLS